MPDPIAKLIDTYHELNAAIIDELPCLPTPLEFHRYVARNRPFVARKAASSWPALRKWDAAYLCEKLKGHDVRIAVTPFGNADAPVHLPSNNQTKDKDKIKSHLVFAEPYEITQSFNAFLSYLQQSSTNSKPKGRSKNVTYLQPQNNALHSPPYDALLHDLPSEDLPFAQQALQSKAEALNFWLGDERSVTALHRDNYENLYVVVRGEKHFVLLPPVDQACVNERALERGRWRPAAATSFEGQPHTPAPFLDNSEDVGEEDLIVVLDPHGEPVPTPTWDPDLPDQYATRYSAMARPLRVTVREGDLLYLPALWYHKVSQTSGKEGFACAVNWWYDMEFVGGFWAGSAFLRDVISAQRNGEEEQMEEARRKVTYPELDLSEEHDDDNG